MGKGKGGIIDWTIPVKKGGVPFLFQGKKTNILKTSLKDLLKKLPIRSNIIESKHNFSQLTPFTGFFYANKFLKNNSIFFKKNL